MNREHADEKQAELYRVAGDINLLANAIVDSEKMTPRRWVAKYGSYTPVKTAMPEEYHELIDDFKEARKVMIANLPKIKITKIGDEVSLMNYQGLGR